LGGLLFSIKSTLSNVAGSGFLRFFSFLPRLHLEAPLFVLVGTLLDELYPLRRLEESFCIISQPQHKFVTEKVSGSLVVKDEWNKSQLSWLYLLPI